jgi:hypothetical protein
MKTTKVYFILFILSLLGYKSHINSYASGKGIKAVLPGNNRLFAFIERIGLVHTDYYDMVRDSKGWIAQSPRLVIYIK